MFLSGHVHVCRSGVEAGGRWFADLYIDLCTLIHLVSKYSCALLLFIPHGCQTLSYDQTECFIIFSKSSCDLYICKTYHSYNDSNVCFCKDRFV